MPAGLDSLNQLLPKVIYGLNFVSARRELFKNLVKPLDDHSVILIETRVITYKKISNTIKIYLPKIMANNRPSLILYPDYPEGDILNRKSGARCGLYHDLKRGITGFF